MNNIDEFVEVYEKLIRGPGVQLLASRDVHHMLETKSFFSIPITSSNAYSLNEGLKLIVQQVPSETRLLFEQRIEECLAEILRDFKIRDAGVQENNEAAAQLPAVQFAVVEEMIKQLSGLDETQLEAGLGVILRDTLEYSLEHRVDGVTFKTIMSFVIAEEEIEGVPEHHRLLFLDPVASIPKGLIAAMRADNLDCTSLKDPSIQHEWTIQPGRRFLRKFNQRHKEFRDSICAADDLNRKFKKNIVSYKEIALAIVKAAVTAGFSESAVWSPLLSYLGLLIMTTTVDINCED